MYEHFKNDMLVELTKKGFDGEKIKDIIVCLDLASNNYDIAKKETQLVLHSNAPLELVKTYIISKSVEGFAVGTLDNYYRCLNNFFLNVPKAPECITANDIRVYLYKYQQARGIKNSSLDKIRGYIASFYKWLVLEGYVAHDPTVGIGKIKKDTKTRQPCSQTDLEYLRMACRTPKQRAILEVLYSTGCRVGELVNLKKSDINWGEGTVRLFGKGKKHRTGFINAKAHVALKEYLATRMDDNEALFVSDRAPYKPMHVSGVQKIVRDMSSRAGDNLSHKVTPHVLRHTTATRMLENKADISSIQAVLGHSNINTTMIYAHQTLDDVKIDHRKAVV